MTKSEEELYYIRAMITTDEYNIPIWRAVDRDCFLRHDGPSVCGMDDSLKGLVASQEGVSANAIHSSWDNRQYVYRVGGDVDVLPELLAYVKEHRYPVIYTGDKNAYKTQRLLKMEAVNVNKNRRHKYHWGLIIAKEWVIEDNYLKYDPTYAAQLLADETVKMSNVIETAPSSPRSKIPCYQVLSPLFYELRDRINNIYPFNEIYPKRRYHQSIAHVRAPNTLKEHIQAIPALLQLYWLLYRNLDYRTKRWKAAIAALLKNHMRDVAMTKDLQRLVTREYAHRQPWEVESEQKGKRIKKSAAT